VDLLQIIMLAIPVALAFFLLGPFVFRLFKKEKDQENHVEPPKE
jgi:hypothetical protein